MLYMDPGNIKKIAEGPATSVREKVDPDTLGNQSCIDLKEQCFYGQEPKKAIMQDPRRGEIVTSECSKRQGSGVIHCCPLELINVLYTPGPYEIPYQVLVENDKYEACPEKIKASCFRESDRQKPICIQAACNDAGYRVASNHYEICKAHRSINEDVPDCPTVGCWGNRFRVPEELDEALDAPRKGETLEKTLQRKRKDTAIEIQEIKQNLENLKKRLSEEKKNEDVKISEGFQVGGADQTEAEQQIAILEAQLSSKEQELEQLNTVLEQNKPETAVVCPPSEAACSGFCISFAFLQQGNDFRTPLFTILCALLVIGITLVNLNMLPQAAS